MSTADDFDKHADDAIQVSREVDREDREAWADEILTEVEQLAEPVPDLSLTPAELAHWRADRAAQQRADDHGAAVLVLILMALAGSVIVSLLILGIMGKL